MRYRWGLARFGALQWWRALEFMPWWLISYMLAVVAAILVILSIVNAGQLSAGEGWWPEVQRGANWFALGSITFKIVAALMFLLRDIFFLLWLNFSGARGRADLTGLVILIVAYIPLPMLLTAAGLTQVLPAVSPLMVGGPADLAWPAAELIAVSILLYLRWRKAARIEIASGHDEPSM